LNTDQPIAIGTCAWTYADWRGTFYPEHLPEPERLAFYARYFSALEVDSTFYHAPAAHAVAHWSEVTPAHFRFFCKMPREITHERKLREAGDALAEFLTALEPLGEKLACILIQLPPFFTLKRDESALRDFVRALPAVVRFAIEFRHASWHIPRIAHLLEEHRVCWAWSDMTPLESQAEGAFAFLPDTADLAYIRLMGDIAQKYDSGRRKIHRYTRLQWPRDAGLESWAVRIRQAAEARREVLVAVSNHFEGFAPETCRRLAARLGWAMPMPSQEEDEQRDRQMELL
jgi:uncharacterized protein YecE (DUF72 family)